MIEYEYLCQAIDDWKAGRATQAPPPMGEEYAEGGDAEPELALEPDGYYDEVEPVTGEAPAGYPEGEPAPAPAYDEDEPPTAAVDAAGAELAYDDAPADLPPPAEGGPTAGYEQHEGDAPELQQYHAEAQPEYASQEPPTVPFQEGAPIETDADLEVEDVEIDDDDDADDDDDGEEVDDVEVADDDDDEDDDDFERDYDLEAVDDYASFDPVNDLTGWFNAEFLIEQGWEDRNQRAQLLAQYGVRNEQHFYQVKATMERWMQSADAQQRYGGLDDIMQLKMNATMDYQRQLMQNRAEGELSGELEPVEGITLEQWAHAQAKVASGQDVAGIIGELGIDQAHWDRVSAEWNARMSRDTTATIATAYGQAFSAGGQGAYAGAAADGAQAMAPGGEVSGDPPIPLERYVELMVAQSAGADQGRDANEVLQSFGMTALDWSNVSAWWSQYLNRHMMENDQALFHEFNRLQEHYEAQYGAGADADEDVEF